MKAVNGQLVRIGTSLLILTKKRAMLPKRDALQTSSFVNLMLPVSEIQLHKGRLKKLRNTA